MAAAPLTMPIDSTDLELDYRAKNYPDSKAIERKQIACATCGKNLSAKIEKPGNVFVHPFTTTLQCKKCSDFYGDGDFSMDEDGDDKYCRICGNGGELYICGSKPCPYGFCQKCIDRYIGKNSAEVQADDWKCLHCNCKPLWEVRAICAVIILEKSKKRRKHKKYPTRGEVHLSDDCSRSEDLDTDFQNSKHAAHRTLRSSRSMRTKIKNKALDRLTEICDSSNDSSDHCHLPDKSTAGKRDSNSKSRTINASGLSQSSSAKKNNAGPSKGKRRLTESEDETSDLKEKQSIRKKQTNSKLRYTFAELESKSVTSKKQTKQSSSESHQRHPETLHRSQRNQTGSESPKIMKNATSESESESSHESANDFVKSKKKKNLRAQIAKSSRKILTIQDKSLTNLESSNSKVGPNRLSTKFGKAVQDKKMRDSSVESRSENTISKKTAKTECYTSESDQEMDVPSKKGTLHVRRKIEQSSDSETEQNPKIRNKVRKPSIVEKESGQASQTKRLSLKPLCPTMQSISSFEYNNRLLDRRKAAIKRSYAKFSSSKDCVSRDQARIIKNRLGSLVSEMKLFGKSLCAGANGIATEHLTSNATSVPSVSKTVLKCALLMIRCKKSLDIIEHEFIESYEQWCQSSKVKSLFSEVEDVHFTANNQAESITRENGSGDVGRIYRSRQESEKERDHLVNQSNTSEDDDNCNMKDQLACSTSTAEHKISNVHLDTRKKSVDNSDDRSNFNSSKKIDVSIPDHKNSDSDRDSRSSGHDAMSDCDGEIFSDDESRAQGNETTEPLTKKICTQSPVSNVSNKQSIESDSDECERVEPRNSVNTEKKSLQSENVTEGPANVIKNQASIARFKQADNKEKLTECSAEESSDVSLRDEGSPQNTQQPDVSLEDISETRVASECGPTPDLREKSGDVSGDDRSVSNDSQNRENVSRTEKSALSETEVNDSSLNNVELLDDNDDEMPDYLDKSTLSKRKSKLSTSDHSSSTNPKEDVDNLSDCDAAIIFTQSPFNDASPHSDTDYDPKSPEEKQAATVDGDKTDSENQSDAEMPLENEVNRTDAASPPKTRSKSPETLVERCDSPTDSDNDKNSKSNSSKTCKKSIERENVENRSTDLLSNKKGNDSNKDIDKLEEDGTGETDPEKEQAATIADDSEEAIKKKILESDSECSEDNEKNQAGPVDRDSEEERKKQILDSDTECSEEFEIKAAKPVDDNSEEAIKKKILESDSESPEDEEQRQATPVDNDSEEAIKNKMLESESEMSEESLAMSSNFKLKMTSDSDENTKQSVPAVPTDTTSNVIPSETGESEKEAGQSEIDPMSPGLVDIDVSALNNLAKQQLLSSSDSSSSDTEDMSLTLAANVDHADSLSGTYQENPICDVDNASTSTTHSKTQRRKIDLETNIFYQTDKKLQSKCQVVVRRLNEKVLDQFKQLLGKSRKRQEWEDFESLIDLKTIKKRKRGTKETNPSESSSESESSKTSSKGNTKKSKSKQVQEKEETLLEHLEKMNNGESYRNLSGDETDDNTENNDALRKIPQEQEAEEEFLAQANKLAKDFLIQSSDSENEMQASVENTREPEQQEEPRSETREEREDDEDIQNEEAVDSETNHENGSNAEQDNEADTANAEEDGDSKQEEDSDSSRTREKKKLKDGLAKRNWRLTDSDSSDEEKKWNKSQQKTTEKERTEPKEEGSKRKKTVKRRVLGSDSDSVRLTDESDDSAEIIDEKKNSSSDSDDSGELFKNLRTTRRRKRNAAQKSGSDSDSEEDEKPTKQKRKRIKKMASDSDSDALTNSQDTPGKLHRKNIRKVLKDKQVADVTKIAGKEEEERLKRIAERQKLYNEMYEMKLASEAKVDKLVLDFDEETKKELVSVHEGLVKRLKPHQAQGIKFMWDACFESLERIKTEKGSGCIVAHCMGLGKTFQVVTLAHTLLTHPETGIKTIMVICPLSTVLNWVNEFKKWLSDINNDEDVEVFEMTKMKKNFERKYQLEKWKRAGGVMVLGYEMFRLLSNQTGKKMRKSLHEGILKCLVDPGPDLIVCDEGHLLKNEDTALSKAMRRVKTLRRIVLTGTPLQNNLVEYHCMVQFVKPNLLGTKKEFLNRFVNPITNGQFDDSTEYDVKLMKKRAHVLHKMLEGSVQRFDYSVLTPFLPPKQEYVITVRLADIQVQLYQHYLDHYSRKKVGAGTSLFADFQALQRIWTHPIVLRMNAEKMEKINEKKRMDASDTEGSLVDFLDDGSSEKSTSSSDSDVQSASSSEEKKEKPRRGTRANPVLLTAKEEEEELQPQISGEWWNQFVEPHHFEDMKISSKLVLLFAILKECEQIGDKVLVFSQSLYALSLIEEFLNKIDDETQRGSCSELIDEHTGSWSLGLDYFRLDGQTPPENRSHYCKIFNNPKNSRARLFLISTRAGGLGINLTAANRVIIFDASWNPSHDVQSIFRIYRFGQKKPCYVYRFLAQGTMEEKIYNRQVTKLSLSCRVVDEQQIERHYSNHDLAELYQFEPNTSKEKPTLNLPKDRLLAEILRKYEDRVETIHEHDSLLENKAEEELDEEERKEAWKEYEDERTGRKVMMNNFPHQNFAMQQYDMLNMNPADIANRATLSGINIDTLQALIRKDYPNSTPEQQTFMTQRAIMDMYTYMESEAIRQQQLAASSYTYPTVSNIGTSSFVDGSVTQTPAQRQYALQQQQLHQIMVQREQQANYAKRFGNVRGPALATTATRTTQPPVVVNLQDDNDIIEIPTTPPATTGIAASSSVQQTPTASVPAAAENSKRQEE